MKKLRIFPSCLEIRTAEFPLGKDFLAVKLSSKEAMAFSATDIRTFDDLISRYGANNRLRPGEFYNGYAVVSFWWGHTEVVSMHGIIQRIDPKTVVSGADYKFADAVRKGLAWECVYPLGEGRFGQGCFNYFWNFRDCTFARQIIWGQEHGWTGYENMNPEAIDKSLKDKIVSALQKEEKIVELTDEEDMVLRHYLGENSYYKSFFVEVE